MAITKTLTASDTDVATIPTAGFGRLLLQVVNSVAALTAFKIQIRAASDGPWHTVFSAAGDYTTPAKIMVMAGDSAGAALDFTTMGSTIKGFILLDIVGIDSVKIVAAGNTAVVTLYSSMT